MLGNSLPRVVGVWRGLRSAEWQGCQCGFSLSHSGGQVDLPSLSQHHNHDILAHHLVHLTISAIEISQLVLTLPFSFAGGSLTSPSCHDGWA